MKISEIAKSIKPSLTRQFFNEAKQYEGIIDLTLGDPDFCTPVEIIHAVNDAMLKNKTHYSENAGLLDARKVIAKNIKKVWNIEADPYSEIILTAGGMEGLYLALLSTIDRGDEVIVLAPYYVNYLQMINMCGGKAVVVDVYDEKDGLVVNKDILEQNVTDRTVAIIINSPNNPTGEVLDIDSLKVIAEVAGKHDLMIISDEVYRTLIYDSVPHHSLLEFDEVRNDVILIDSLSKEYSMTGWRIGYVYGTGKLISEMTKLQENIVACAALPSQYALIEAYGNDVDNSYILDSFQQRRDCIYYELSKIENVSCRKPQATFYLFLNIKKTGFNSLRFAYELLREKKVAVVPGVAYGDNYDDYVRIAFTQNENILKDASDRIKSFINEQKLNY